MPGQDKEEKDYQLYTEHIVPGTGKKIKQYLKKFLLVFAMAAVFGLVAGLVMIIVYRTGSKMVGEEPNVTLPIPVVTSAPETENLPQETVTIPLVDETEPPETEQSTTAPDEDETDSEGINDFTNTLKNVYKTAESSIVDVLAVSSGKDGMDAGYRNISEEFGLIVGSDRTHYYILTDYSIVKNSDTITVKYNDGTDGDAILTAGDATTGIAVIKADISPSEEVGVAALGDSSLVQKGDMIIAVGKLYGSNHSVGYGIASDVDNRICGTDSEYGMIQTDISATGTVSGVLCNLKGEVVGIITPNYNAVSSNINAYSIIELRTLIENLMNSKQTVYFGIKGQSITDEIKKTYGLPDGVYVSAVEVNSPAFAAGIQTGDILTAVGHKEITNMSEFMSALSNYRNGDTVDISVKRKARDSYKEIVFSVVLGVE